MSQVFQLMNITTICSQSTLPASTHSIATMWLLDSLKVR